MATAKDYGQIGILMRGDHLTKQKGSNNWYVQLHTPRDLRHRIMPKLLKSLHTPDRALALARAAEWELKWRQMLVVFRTVERKHYDEVPAEAWTQKPGTKIEHDDGTVSVATETHILTLDRDSLPISQVPNVNDKKTSLRWHPEAEKAWETAVKDDPRFSKIDGEWVKKRRTDIDRNILEFYYAEATVTDAIRKDAERAYERFKLAAPGKTFATATRSDGREMARYIVEIQGRNSQTAVKQVNHLNAACNAALAYPEKFPTLKLNPFSNVAKVGNDIKDVRQYDDKEMRKILDDLPNWTEQERLLWVLCASSGMRREEAFQIDGEETFHGYRCLRFGKKTDRSDRTLPIPSAALPYLPAVITGPLFGNSVEFVSKGVYARLAALGISKRLHSCRHRASNRMDSRVQDSVRDTVLGHWDASLERLKKAKAKHHYWRGHSPDVIYAAIEMIGLS